MMCKKCGEIIPKKLVIDGREKVLNSRKYCLNCSPFNLHNTAKLETVVKGDTTMCADCGKSYTYIKSKGHTKTLCNSCASNRKRFSLKERCVAYKGGKCFKCGYSKCLDALEFHHPSDDKTFNISGNHCLSWDKIKVELDKTDLMCSNCHREEHYKINHANIA